MRSGNYNEVEDCLFKWFTNESSSNRAISGEILAEKSEEFAKKLGVSDFKCSSGYIDRFKKRRGITGLFYMCEPAKSLYLKGDQCQGEKRSKESACRIKYGWFGKTQTPSHWQISKSKVSKKCQKLPYLFLRKFTCVDE